MPIARCGWACTNAAIANPGLDQLTARGRDVLLAVVRGLPNTEIGTESFIAEQTVKSHVSELLRKLARRDRVQLVIVAYEAGLIRPGGGQKVWRVTSTAHRAHRTFRHLGAETWEYPCHEQARWGAIRFQPQRRRGEHRDGGAAPLPQLLGAAHRQGSWASPFPGTARGRSARRRPSPVPPRESVSAPGGADRTAIGWQGLDLDGAFALAAEADDNRDTPGVLAQAREGEASFVLVTVPANQEWAVAHLFFASGDQRRHMSLTSMVSTLAPEVTEVGCAYEHSDRGPRYHYAVIRRPSTDTKLRARLDDGAWKDLTRGQDGWLVTISTAHDSDSGMHLEELVHGKWHQLR